MSSSQNPDPYRVPGEREPPARARLFFALFAAVALTACEPGPAFVTYECVEPTAEEQRQKAEFIVRCVEAGGRGVRSTEDWVEACARSMPSHCTKEMVVVQNQEGGFARIPCQKTGATTGRAMCVAAGWKDEPR